MRGRISAFGVFLFVLLSSSSTISRELCLHGCPAGAPETNRTIIRTQYILNNNGSRKFADWVAYRIAADTIGPTKRRVWKRDPDLPASETMTKADYRRAHEVLKVDRGHQAPLAGFTRTANWEVLNFLSNITPQATALNQGPWERLEAAERTLARRSDVTAVYTTTGPLYERDMPRLPHSVKAHSLPSGYWKVIAVEENGDIRTAAFVMEQGLPRKADFCASKTALREVERRAGLTLFSELRNEQRALIDDSEGRLLDDLGCN